MHDYLSDSRDESVRSRTNLALSALGDRGALPIIKQLLLDPEVVTEATTALVNMDGKNALPDILIALEVIISFERNTIGRQTLSSMRSITYMILLRSHLYSG